LIKIENNKNLLLNIRIWKTENAEGALSMRRSFGVEQRD